MSGKGRSAAMRKRLDEQRESLPATCADIFTHGYQHGLHGSSVNCCPFPLESDGGRKWLEGHKAGCDVFNDIAEDQMRGDPYHWEIDLMVLIGIFVACGWLIYKIYA